MGVPALSYNKQCGIEVHLHDTTNHTYSLGGELDQDGHHCTKLTSEFCSTAIRLSQTPTAQRPDDGHEAFVGSFSPDLVMVGECS